jgi:hypothetical protein
MNKSCLKHSNCSGAASFPSKSAYLLNKNILLHPCSLNSVYLLDQNILAHPLSIKFYIPTWQKYSSAPSFFQSLHTYLTKIFKRTLFLSNSTYLLDEDILAHPLSIKFYVPTWQKHSSAPSFYQILRTYSTKFSSAPSFYWILCTYSTKKSSAPSFYQILRTYSTKKF